VPQKKNQPRPSHNDDQQTSHASRWPDRTPRSQNNAFTGNGFTDEERARASLSRTQVLNGHLPKSKHMPWDGPLTERGPK
jgi:hypothetical protein